MKDIHQVIVDTCQAGGEHAVAVVLECDGSTPRKAGTKALIDVDGTIHGTIGGGAVEAEAQRRAKTVLQTQQAIVFDFNLQGAGVPAASPICGGKMRVLLHLVTAEHLAGYAAAAAAQQRRERGVLLTGLHPFRISDFGFSPASPPAPPPEVTVHFVAERDLAGVTGFPSLTDLASVLKREAPAFLLSGALREAAVPTVSPPSPHATRGAGERGVPGFMAGEEDRREPEASPEAQPQAALVEPILPRPVLLIVGGGHVGQAVAVQASWVGFDVVVLDDRPEFTRRELFPEGAATCCGDVVRELALFPFTPETYVVIVTRGHQHDAIALAACLDPPVAYLGMIGSRRKVALLWEDFIASGRATAESFARVHAPIGLDIGAVTVPEIATSIVAEMIAVRRKKANSSTSRP